MRLLLSLLLTALTAWGAVRLGGNVAPDGVTEVQCDLPTEERLRNIGSRVDRAGMCVMSSVEMAARWAGLDQMRGLRDWCAQQPGGGYPSKVDRQLTEFCRSRGLVCPEYVQEERATLDTVRAVLASGRIPCVTYSGQDGVRYKGPIAHMVCAVHCDANQIGLLDNNAIGERELLWMTPRDFEQRFGGKNGGWVFYWLAPPPPPMPRN